jgi:hypothetical protein
MAFPGRVLANPNLEVINAQSRPYPRRQRKCEAAFCAATERLLAEAPAEWLGRFRPHPWFARLPDCMARLDAAVANRSGSAAALAASARGCDCFPAEHLCVLGEPVRPAAPSLATTADGGGMTGQA